MTESQITNPLLSREPQPINVDIQRIYVKEQSCKIPHSNQADVQQAVVIKTNSTDEKPLNHLMNTAAPTLLYPYIRQVIADAIYNAGFPPIFLPHVDFAAMHQQRVQAKDTETLEKIKAFVTAPSTAEESDVTVH